MKLIETKPKTKRGAIRQYNAVIREAYKKLQGGTRFGIDLPTMRVVWKEGYNKIAELRSTYALLPN